MSLHEQTATEMMAALNAKTVSSVELVDAHISRIESVDDEVNAIAVRTFDRARHAAADADQRRTDGESAPLLGLPLTLKESTLVAGLPQSAGVPELAEYHPTEDGPAAERAFTAGACLLGKTNIPVGLGDWQADSPVYGRTNNPWDLSRTPGGSTGGGAAALAARMTPLEMGSDIGGSIRVPAAYCGVYGHRPSQTAIPRSGAMPMADRYNPAFLLGVQGPLARSASDLELFFDVLAGPERGEEVAWNLVLPAARHDSLSDFRVAVIPSVLGVPVSSSVSEKLEELVGVLTDAGATVREAAPDFDMEASYHDYLRLLMMLISQGQDPEMRVGMAEALRAKDTAASRAQAEGLLLGGHDLMALIDRRQMLCMAWRSFFTSWDVVLTPAVVGSAFPHQDFGNGGGILEDRQLDVDGHTIPYVDNLVYSMLATHPGLPSTAIPAGTDENGLPIGLQLMGPYLEDRTTLRLAQLIEVAWRGFEPPPDYV